MKNAVLSLVLATMLLWSCGGGEKPQPEQAQEAKGGVVYGGVFKVNEVEDFRSLFPLNITEVTGHRIAGQMYEGLVRFDQADLSILPAIAESWEVDDAGTLWTFKIRKGVFFHDDACFEGGKGREVTAEDVKYCFTQLCTSNPENQLFWLMDGKLKGAREYYDSTVDGAPLADGVSGLTVADANTLQVELNYPVSDFLKTLAQPGCWVFPKEAFEKYGIEMRTHCVGTGAFQVKTVKEGEAIIMERNKSYWRTDEFGNQLPYLHAVKVSFLKEKKNELLKFKKGNLDMVFRLPIEMIGVVVGELEDARKGANQPFDSQTIPAFGTEYFGFNHNFEVFKDKRVRRAFNLAIDRETFVTYVLQGDGIAGNYGIVPPGFEAYEYEKLKGFEYNPDEAQRLMSQAGYPNGEGFPEIELQLNSGGQNNIRVAEAIRKMLAENLGVELKLNIMPMAEHYDKVETGNAVFWRTAWLADYPDPENFINLLYGGNVPEDPHAKAYLNSERYISTTYDSLVDLARRELDETRRNDLIRMADQQQIDDAAIIPIFYNEYTRLVNSDVKNFPQNPMEYRDLAEVYFKKDEE